MHTDHFLQYILNLEIMFDNQPCSCLAIIHLKTLLHMADVNLAIKNKLVYSNRFNLLQFTL